jgi:hypothetical protein
MIAVDLLAYAQTLLLHDTPLARVEPKTLRLPAAARRRPAHPRRPPPPAPHSPAGLPSKTHAAAATPQPDGLVVSDAFDAFLLADSLRHEHRHWRPLGPPSPLLAELRALTRDREG